MIVRTLALASFSPTGTTRAILQGIAKGITNRITLPTQDIDMTPPSARCAPFAAGADTLLVMGVPVYMGRVPVLLSDWFQTLTLLRTPTVCVVVYGNRAYDNALLELRDIVTARGGIPVAAAAFIGEHSFSSTELPASAGRPNVSDLQQAEALGHRVAERLTAASSMAEVPPLVVPGSLPYGGVTKLWDVDFIEVGADCIRCGTCATHCPTGAIDATDSAKVDIAQCITCCACIKRCPTHSRTKKPGPVMDASRRIHTLYPAPKQPELFL